MKPVEFDVLVAFMMVVGLDSIGELPNTVKTFPRQPQNNPNRSLTAHAADPNTKTVITRAPEFSWTFRDHRPNRQIEPVLMVMLLRSNSHRKAPKHVKHS